jgi:dCTP deaminase
VIITGKQILKEMRRGNIHIDPYDPERLNPNSYNLRLHNKLLVLKDGMLDMREESSYDEVEIQESGYLLEPGRLYLGRTVEYTETRKHVPMLEGRSSIARLGIFIHATAGFGDIGFSGYWTLEISVIQPVVIYPYVEICQIYYHTIKGKFEEYVGKYQRNEGIQVSQIWKELGKKG